MDLIELHSDPLYVKVYNLLKQRILSGRLLPGERLRETALAADLQVSRTPVRDALRRLEQDGLIAPAPGSAYLISRPSRSELEHLYGARAVLEGGAARLAAARNDTVSLDAMAGVLAEMEQAYARSETPLLVQLDMRFHELLMAAAGNPVLVELTGRLETRLRHMRNASSDVNVRGPQVLVQHTAMLAALRSHDAAAAEATTLAHIRYVCTKALEAFDRHQGASPTDPHEQTGGRPQ